MEITKLSPFSFVSFYYDNGKNVKKENCANWKEEKGKNWVFREKEEKEEEEQVGGGEGGESRV